MEITGNEKYNGRSDKGEREKKREIQEECKKKKKTMKITGNQEIHRKKREMKIKVIKRRKRWREKIRKNKKRY